MLWKGEREREGEWKGERERGRVDVWKGERERGREKVRGRGVPVFRIVRWSYPLPKTFGTVS